MVFVKVNQVELAVINMQARSFMVDLDDPFRKMDRLIAEAKKERQSFSLIFMEKRQVRNKPWDGS